MRFILGVDEAGRGPLAGPVAVGIVAAPADFDLLAAFPGLNDSKQLPEKERERIFALLIEQETVQWRVEWGSAKTIDEHGMTKAVARAITRGIRKLAVPQDARVFLDGLLHAPEEYVQETVIRGDETVPAIMLASVAAKVTRDRLMQRLSKRYPAYGFERHKGYPTKAHYEAIRTHGLCDIHRRRYCSAIAPSLSN